LPVEDTNPTVLKLPPLTLPETDNDVNIPTDVITGCAALLTLLAVLANAGIAAKFASSWLNGIGLDSVPKVYGTVIFYPKILRLGNTRYLSYSVVLLLEYMSTGAVNCILPPSNVVPGGVP